MTNANGADAGAFTLRAHEIVAPAVNKAKDLSESKAHEPRDPRLAQYVGTYVNPWGGEIAVLPWKGSLAMLYLPTENPMRGLAELRHIENDVFRRVRKDGELAEPIAFTVEDGQVTRFTRHSNHYRRR